MKEEFKPYKCKCDKRFQGILELRKHVEKCKVASQHVIVAHEYHPWRELNEAQQHAFGKISK